MGTGPFKILCSMYVNKTKDEYGQEKLQKNLNSQQDYTHHCMLSYRFHIFDHKKKGKKPFEIG